MSGQAGSGGGGAGPPPAASAYRSPSTDGKRRSTRFKDEDEYVEVTLDVRGDGDGAVAVRSVKGVAAPDAQGAALLGGPAPAPAPGPGGLSSKLRALRRIASGSTRAAGVPLSALLRGDRPAARLDRSVTGAASALRGLQFLNQAAVTEGWPEVEKRFHRLAVDGFLLRSRFGQCIGELHASPFFLSISLSTLNSLDLEGKKQKKMNISEWCRDGWIRGVRRADLRLPCAAKRDHRAGAHQGAAPGVLGAAL